MNIADLNEMELRAEVERCHARITQLLEANNAEVDRRRAAARSALRLRDVLRLVAVEACKCGKCDQCLGIGKVFTLGNWSACDKCSSKGVVTECATCKILKDAKE